MLIEMRDVIKTFRTKEVMTYALREVTISLDRGDYLSIQGPSGSGKSTLLSILGLLETPSSGSFLVDGEDVGAWSDSRKSRARGSKIGFILQDFNLLPHLTAASNIELPLIYNGTPKIQRDRAVRESLSMMGLGSRAKHLPNQLSGGQQQRVAIARAVCIGPSLILADEPTGNLDTESAMETVKLLEEQLDSGCAIVMVTHDPGIASRSRRRLRLVDGVLSELANT